MLFWNFHNCKRKKWVRTIKDMLVQDIPVKDKSSPVSTRKGCCKVQDCNLNNSQKGIYREEYKILIIQYLAEPQHFAFQGHPKQEVPSCISLISKHFICISFCMKKVPETLVLETRRLGNSSKGYQRVERTFMKSWNGSLSAIACLTDHLPLFSEVIWNVWVP